MKKFLESIIQEQLHPELRAIIDAPRHSVIKKQTFLARKIKELSERGEHTGIVGNNMPAGSSRAYLPIEEPHHIMLDGQQAQLKTGIKVSIHNPLDKFHLRGGKDRIPLGNMQNEVEGGDHFMNSEYRILVHKEDNEYESNKEKGIFPPLIDHDHDKHEWSHVGHIRNLKPSEFRQLTKTPEHPTGITHGDVHSVLYRDWSRRHGGWHDDSASDNERLDQLEQHPFIQKALDFHRNYDFPPHDLQQKSNWGVFEHPDGSRHPIIRDGGFNQDVMHAYRDARLKQNRAGFSPRDVFSSFRRAWRNR